MTRSVERRRASGAAGRTAYLHTIAAENLPIGLPDLPATDVVSWLEQHTDLLDDIATVASRVDAPVSLTGGGRAVVGGVRPIAVPAGSRNSLHFIWFGGAFLLKALWRLLRVDWTSAILSPMLIDALLLGSTQGHGQAAIHIFNSTGAARRPLWTLIAPQFEIRTLCYHYSTNIHGPLFRSLDPHRCLANEVPLYWWDEQLAWDSQHAGILTSTAERPGKVRIVGPVSFVATRQRLGPAVRGGIAVFDVTPTSETRRAAIPSAYNTPELVEAFIRDIAETAAEYGLHIAWKSKRAVHPRHHDQSYPLLRERMREHHGTHIVDPRVSAEQLIESSIAVVSMAFTSTGHIAHAANKPSSFYDPSAAVDHSHPDRRGLHLLTSQESLHVWLGSIVRNTLVRGP